MSGQAARLTCFMRAPPFANLAAQHMSGHPWPRTEGCPYLNSELRTVVQPKESP